MSKVSKVFKQDGTEIDGRYMVKVPCDCGWHVYTCGDQYPESHRWAFNGDFGKPTFRESYLATHPDYRCHSYVTDGFVEYCHDCTHDLKNQRLPLLDVS